MSRHGLFLIVSFVLSSTVYGSHTARLVVHNGDNTVPLTLRNETGYPVDVLEILPDDEPLPDWLQFGPTNVVSSPETGIRQAILNVTVSDQAEGVSAHVPVLLRDQAGRTWPVSFDIQVSHALIHEDVLLQNAPNPFNAETVLEFHLAGTVSRPTKLVIYNILGQTVRTLVDEEREPGIYKVRWDGRDDGGRVVASGVYIYHIAAGSFRQTRKTMLLK